MKKATSPRVSRSYRKRTSFADGIRLRMGALINERDKLEEEVRQLRATVQIYSEVVNRLQVQRPAARRVS